MRKFRASMEPFWDLKISKYVEYLTCVSSEYFSLYKQRDTFSDKYHWPKLTRSFGLCNPRPKASLVLHIACNTATMHQSLCHATTDL
jgi:hypothetical protein